jgi:hypothetical protein
MYEFKFLIVTNSKSMKWKNTRKQEHAGLISGVAGF